MKGSINKGEASSTTRRRKRDNTSSTSSKRKSTTAVFCLWVVFIFTQFRSSISSSSIHHRHDDMIGGRARFLHSGSVPFVSGPSSRFANNRGNDHHSPGLLFDEDKRKVHTGHRSKGCCSSKKAIRRELEKKEQ